MSRTFFWNTQKIANDVLGHPVLMPAVILEMSRSRTHSLLLGLKTQVCRVFILVFLQMMAARVCSLMAASCSVKLIL